MILEISTRNVVMDETRITFQIQASTDFPDCKIPINLI